MILRRLSGSGEQPRGRLAAVFAILVMAILIISGCAGGPPQTPSTIRSMDDQSLNPGLSVLYFNRFVRHVGQLPEGKSAERAGRVGAPIPMLDHRFGKGEVFGSGRSRGVGLQLTGFIRFDAPGEYVLKARSNDGIRLYINGQMIFEDPTVHSDRFSPEGSVQVTTAGWYPLLIQYFQRKGTATLELYWQIPGADGFKIIPAEAYAHPKTL